jgi:predicted CopG family antitoxin
MATKTISIDMEAYKILRRERKGREDSFSQVIRRLHAAQPARTFGEFIAHHEPKLLGRGFGGARRRAKATAA